MQDNQARDIDCLFAWIEFFNRGNTEGIHFSEILCLTFVYVLF